MSTIFQEALEVLAHFHEILFLVQSASESTGCASLKHFQGKQHYNWKFTFSYLNVFIKEGSCEFPSRCLGQMFYIQMFAAQYRLFTTRCHS